MNYNAPRKRRPCWVRAGSLLAARATVFLFLLTVAVMILNLTVRNYPHWFEVLIVAPGTIWALSQWLWMERDFLHIDEELRDLIEHDGDN